MSCPSIYNIRGMSNTLFDKLGTFCCWYLFPLKAYCLTIALAGLIVTTLDIHRVLVDGPTLSDKVWPMRLEGSDTNKAISEEAERDVKLVTSVIEWTVYCCLLIGAYYETPLFLLPWVSLRLFIIAFSILISCLKLVSQKPLELSAMGLIGGLLGIHNCFYVICFFKKLFYIQSVTSWF